MTSPPLGRYAAFVPALVCVFATARAISADRSCPGPSRGPAGRPLRRGRSPGTDVHGERRRGASEPRWGESWLRMHGRHRTRLRGSESGGECTDEEIPTCGPRSALRYLVASLRACCARAPDHARSRGLRQARGTWGRDRHAGQKKAPAVSDRGRCGAVRAKSTWIPATDDGEGAVHTVSDSGPCRR